MCMCVTSSKKYTEPPCRVTHQQLLPVSVFWNLWFRQSLKSWTTCSARSRMHEQQPPKQVQFETQRHSKQVIQSGIKPTRISILAALPANSGESPASMNLRHKLTSIPITQTVIAYPSADKSGEIRTWTSPRASCSPDTAYDHSRLVRQSDGVQTASLKEGEHSSWSHRNRKSS